MGDWVHKWLITSCGVWRGKSFLPLIYHLYRYVDAWNSTHIVQIKIRSQCLQTLYHKVRLLSACAYHFRWQWFMCLIASTRLFNEATSAVTPTSTHVDYVVLWLLLLLAKTMLFLFWKRCPRASHLQMKVWTLTIGKILGLVQEPEQMTTTGTSCVLNMERNSRQSCTGVSLSRST